ncbi:MAG: DUF4157 domain-containing protein [Bacteroidota bacterium]
MKTPADKIKRQKTKNNLNEGSKTKNSQKSADQLVERTPDLATKDKLKTMAEISPHLKQLRTYQKMADNSLQNEKATQLQELANKKSKKKQPKKGTKTNLPNSLKSGIENLSGFSMDDVRVHRNSGKPAQLKAHAYAQGSNIHLGPGQEKHLPHEAWHVVQQKQGRVKPTKKVNGNVNVNDNRNLEKEADKMGKKASSMKTKTGDQGGGKEKTTGTPVTNQHKAIDEQTPKTSNAKAGTVQRKISVDSVDYSADSLEAHLKTTDMEWDDVYSQVLTSFDTKNKEFADMEALTELLIYNAEKLVEHKDEAATAWNPYDWEPGKGDHLHDLAFNVIANAITDKTAISEMSFDEIYSYTPETQIAYCLKLCKDDTEDVLALALYTSYLYEPLNRYFRGQSEPDDTTDFGKLVLKTADVLQSSYEEEDAKPIKDKRYKLELKSGWINGDEESLSFPSLTSTHPNIGGVKSMWSDIASGTFGDYDNFALLSFEGTAKTKRPVKKYFDSESEDLMGPGASYMVIDKYSLEGDIPDIGHKTIRVFRLSNIPSDVDESDRLKFEDLF